MIKHSSVVSLANIWPPPITEIYIELYGWGRCDITEMRFFKKNSLSNVDLQHLQY